MGLHLSYCSLRSSTGMTLLKWSLWLLPCIRNGKQNKFCIVYHTICTGSPLVMFSNSRSSSRWVWQYSHLTVSYFISVSVLPPNGFTLYNSINTSTWRLRTLSWYLYSHFWTLLKKTYLFCNASITILTAKDSWQKGLSCLHYRIDTSSFIQVVSIYLNIALLGPNGFSQHQYRLTSIRWFPSASI